MKLNFKLQQVLLLVVLLVSSVSFAMGGIVYTDISDGVPNGIDFNQDGTNEFDIDTYGMSVPGDNMSYYDYGADNNIHAIDADHWDVPSCLTAGFSVNASCNWLGYGDCAINGWGESNPTLLTNQDNYLGMRFNIGSDVFYGWVRFFYDQDGVITYKDYAYNNVPNSAIVTGDMGSMPILVSSIQLSSVGNQNIIDVLDGTLQILAEVLPANADDNSITWLVENVSGEATISQSGLLTAVSDGIVTVKAMANDDSGVYGELDITISNQFVGSAILSTVETSIYPNPCTDVINISHDNSTNSTLSILTADGRSVIDACICDSVTTIDLSALDKGVYVCIIKSQNIICYQKTIVKI